ncbi:MAG TPA: SseB family protein [Rhizomicrobium sp.]|nr:SseB family protein [Rhizomicrobium sp.]
MDFVPENSLEEAMVAMAADPAAIPQFERLLLESPLHVIGQNEGAEDGSEPEKLVEGAQVRLIAIRRGDAQYLPVFTSPARLQMFFENATKSALIRRYITMGGRSLFQMAKDAPFLLNPGFPYGLELPASAIARLLQKT